MSWQDRHAKASFRGFDFLTDSHDASYGRRLVAHEFPNTDEPELEDFGLKAKSWRLNAYFIGPDYDLEANGFLAKLAAPGAEWLQHPWLGALWVRARDWSRTESNDKNGFCTITIEFVPGGRAQSTPTVDKVDAAIARIKQSNTVAVESFALNPMSSDVLGGLVADVQQHLDGLRDAISLATLPVTWANQVLNVVNGVKNDIQTLLQIPQDYATALANMADLLGSGAGLGIELDSRQRARAVSRITATAMQPKSIDASPIISTDYKANVQAEASLRSQLLISAAAELALSDYQDAQTRDAVLANITAAIDSQLGNMGDDVFHAFSDLRQSIIEALLDQDLTPAQIRDLITAQPSAVLAYDMALTEVELIERNAVRHPLFIVGRIYG